jgi:V8-like Glu-specific endopeptidase
MPELLHRHIGALLFTDTRTTYKGKGSGILISPNLVLTSAHNIYNRGILNTDFKFYPGLNGELQQFYTIEQFFVPAQFLLDSSPINDYALLKLTEKIQNQNPFIGLSGNI